MVSSYLPELFGVCDRLAVMSRGVLTAARPVAEWDRAFGDGSRDRVVSEVDSGVGRPTVAVEVP